MRTIAQAMRRMGQQVNGWNKPISDQGAQFPLAKKLYKRNGLDLVMTCGACPEQYDVFRNGEQVGYLRLRHGEFTAEYPDCGGKFLFELYPDGDGIFEAYERLNFLSKALRAILKEINNTQS